MADPLLIYGATGYTGRLIARAALARGLHPVLAGRDAGRLKLLSESLGGLEVRQARIDSPAELSQALDGSRVVINAAGPFSRTAEPISRACMAAGTHYQDVTGEVDVFASVAECGGEARRRGVMLLPGVGFDVVPSDCLAARVAAKAPEATWLCLGIRGLVHASRGSYRTILEQLGRPIMIRRGHRVQEAPAGQLTRAFDFGEGPRESIGVSWGDVVTAWHSTGIGDIGVYFEATPAIRVATGMSRLLGSLLRSHTLRALLNTQADLIPEGPSDEALARHECVIVAEAGDATGVRARSRMRTPEAYRLTAHSATLVATRVLGGTFEPGFQTPAALLGQDFAMELPGVWCEDF